MALKRFILKNAAIGILSILGLAACGSTATQHEEPVVSVPQAEPIAQFVKQSGKQLMLSGQSFRFAGASNFYLHRSDNVTITSFLDDAEAMGLNSVRIFGFLDGEDYNMSLQPELGVFKKAGQKDALERIDFIVHQASLRGIRLVIVLTNNWPEYGGVPQYVKWLDLESHDEFFSSKQAKEAYKKYAAHLIGRENQYTGKRYSDDPTIMTWELINAPRTQDTSGQLLVEWADEMSRYVKSIAPQQLVALGSEGFFNRPGNTDWNYNGSEGVDWERLIRLPNIDYGTFHLYPEYWEKADVEAWGTQWIVEHAEAASLANKPFVLEEYAILANDINNRDFVYDKWHRTAYAQGASGTMVWGLNSFKDAAKKELYPDYDGYRVLADQGRTHQLLAQHSLVMRGLLPGYDARSYITTPSPLQRIDNKWLTVKANVLAASSSAKSMSVRTSVDSYELDGPDAEGYYTAYVELDPSTLGEQQISLVTKLDNGQRLSDKSSVLYNPTVVGYERTFTYDFSSGLKQGWHSDGAWQAKWNKPALTISDDLGKSMLKLNGELPGLEEWEELKIRNSRIQNLNRQDRIVFTAYIPADETGAGGVRPYAALADGWVKLGIDQYRESVSSLEKVIVDDQVYYKQLVEIELGNTAGKQPDIYICFVGEKLPLSKPVYLDDIHFEKALYK
ncbi:cellulase family glycosylhydrolase [Agarivorans albus]